MASKAAARTVKKESKMVERQKTGIPGFDDLVEGGIPKHSMNLISGTSGTGKTTFCGQFIFEGAKAGEPGIYITMEEEPESVKNNWRLFGWDVDDLIKRKLLKIVQPELYKYDVLMRSVEDSIDSINAERVAVDSISMIGLYFQDPFQVRKSILDFGRMLKRLKCTALSIAELEEGSQKISTFGVEEYVADGVVVLHYIRQGNVFNRAISIRKMRATNHSTKIHPIQISKRGIVVYPSEELFADMR